MIVEIRETDKNTIKNGVQIIYYKSPLATAIVGHKTGDIIKLGNLDNFVEILEILK